MLIGIDVGGTYTDGVAVDEQGRVLAWAKYPTDKGRLLFSLTGCLDQMLGGFKPQDTRRVAISTTLLTNAILEKNLAETALITIPGTGLTVSNQSYGTEPYVLDGAVNFRGREISPLNLGQVEEMCGRIIKHGFNSAAVCGKFSPRNHIQEQTVAALLKQLSPSMQVELGHRHYGTLNFPRRVNTAYLTAATRAIYQDFLTQVESAVRERGITAPIVILKADGGTVPLAAAGRFPLETVYSGPAASILGVMALNAAVKTCCVIDIGGTTTDLGLVLQGTPLYSAKGAEIGEFKTLVKSFALSSAAVGGDSPVYVRDSKLELGKRRRGAAFCLGGPAVTPTDALRYLDLVEHGSKGLAAEAMQTIGGDLRVGPREAAALVLELVVDRICAAYTEVLKKWQNEPAYRVWQVLNMRKLDRGKLVGVGGGARGIVPKVAERLNTDWEVPELASVANALGAAVARVTFSCSLRADTALKTYTIAETGVQRAWPYGLGNLAEAKTLVREHFAQMARDIGEDNLVGVITREEVFNMARGFYTEGKIIEVVMERQAGVLTPVDKRCTV